ncbi:sugar phosphate isomerase/epimerase [Microbacterium sp. Marseille-Q6648]|uniref:sugar phosphate isomerase/epimerase n=1 Tax=Microbacterium sp. Marseille-Q6648 TaxID=2937991 RepID=UPI00203A8551|nr:sugar phosphate isomerase/epimerase [Microbacterium sp. Marseille-Q6648]
MTLHALRDDALQSAPDGFTLRLGLPWIRSLPVSSLVDLEVTVDGEPVAEPRVEADAADWWFLQDRLDVRGDRPLAAGAHQVVVGFRLVVPYLQAGPGGPLALPFRIERDLVLDAGAPSSRRSAPRSGSGAAADGYPDAERAAQPRDEARWTLAASGFNVTPLVIAADRPATDLVVDLARNVARVVELEPGQLWRTFPAPEDAEVDAFRDRLAAAGGSVSIVGASLDDWTGAGQRLDDDERLAFLLPQLRAASRVGAQGVRLPIGQAGRALLQRLVPHLEQLDLVLLEEIQGQQTPDSPATSAALDSIAALDHPLVRVLVDISMLMPALPLSYLERLRAGGIPHDLVARLENDWRDPATAEAVVTHLRSGAVPGAVHTLYMNLLVRFGRSDATVLRGILPLVGAFHLKFWDLDDSDGRVSNPIRDVGTLLRGSDFTGTLCSEWGGHEWLDDDPYEITRGHLELARDALAQGASLTARTPNR